MAAVPETYSVGELAALAHVSVRTLHHYDEIGLLVPSERTTAGYRRYCEGDVIRLRQILFYRELDFGLESIVEMLAEPGRPSMTTCAASTACCASRSTVAAICSRRSRRRWRPEARDRWRDTDAFKESQRRTSAYRKQDWQRLKEESDAGLIAFRDAMTSGVPPTSGEAMLLAESHCCPALPRAYTLFAPIRVQQRGKVDTPARRLALR